MDVFEIQKCLDSMQILVDNREQPSERAERRYKDFSAPYRRQTLNYGDYTYNFTLPDGTELFNSDESVKGHCIIERKMNLEELSSCFTQRKSQDYEYDYRGKDPRNRFEAEFQRAVLNNASIYLLVENATWENLMNGRYKTKYNSKAFLSSLTAFMARYHIQLVFCKSESSGKIIKEILYRELKERLEVGVYG